MNVVLTAGMCRLVMWKITALTTTAMIGGFLAACGGAAPRIDGHELLGRVILFDQGDGFRWTSESCSGSGSFGDLTEGMEIAVVGSNEDILGQSSLGEGRPVTAGACEVRFIVSRLPETPRYVIRLGHGGGRGEPAFTFTELSDLGWRFDVSIGERPEQLAGWTPPPF